ncbi:hypothetical protein ABPG75_003354 [Micractinium tetrahymenae]
MTACCRSTCRLMSAAMKRNREDAGLDGRAWELIQLGESRPGSDSSGGQRHVLAEQDAYVFIRELKTRFASRREVFGEFLAAMKGYREGALDQAAVIQRMQCLLAGHQDLLAAFGMFLPPECAPMLQGPPSPQATEAAVAQQPA